MMHNKEDLKLMKMQSVRRAKNEVSQFVGKNIDVLRDVINDLCNALDDRQISKAGKLSYRLSTMAPLYTRPDYANMADFLCKILQNKDFTDHDGICELFSNNFKELSYAQEHKPDLEQKILTKTRAALVAFRS